MRPNLTPQELEELRRITNRDPYPNNFPDDYDKSKVDPRVRLRTSAVKNKLIGLDTREAMEQAPEIISVVATEAKELSDETSERQDDLEERWDAVVSGTTDGAEVIEARVDMERERQTSLSTRLLKDFTDRLTKAQLVKFLAGENITITDTFDFNDKVAGSNVENPNNFYYGGTSWTTLNSPSATWGVGSQVHYDSLKKVDGNVVTAGRYGANIIAQGRVAFNLLAEYKKRYPHVFLSDNTDTVNLALLKSKLASIEPCMYVKGSSSSGNKVSAGPYSNPENNWWLMGSNTSGDIAKISSVYTTATQISYLLNAQGIVNINYYAGAATETVASIAILDYASVKGTININIKDFTAHQDLTTITHNLNDYPAVRVMSHSNGIGTTGLSEEPQGFGGSNVVSIESSVEYLDTNRLKVKVPREYMMSSPTITALSPTRYLLVAGVNSLTIDIKL